METCNWDFYNDGTFMLWVDDEEDLDMGVDFEQTEMTLSRMEDYVAPGKPEECEGEDCPETCEGADCVDEPEVCLIPEGCDVDKPVVGVEEHLREMLSGKWIWSFNGGEQFMLQINRVGTCDVYVPDAESDENEYKPFDLDFCHWSLEHGQF